MNIVLSILEILGWSLLVLLFVLVLLLLIVLFCPIRYLVEGVWLEEKWVKFKAHWLWRLIRAKITYEDDLVYIEACLFWKKYTFSYDLTKKEEDSGLDEEIAEDVEDENVLETDTVDEKEQESIVSKIKGILERIKEIYVKTKKILEDEKNQDAIKHIKEEILYLIKIFLPKKSKIDAVFSTGSPDTTGQLFGVLALFPAMYQRNWKIIPDFQADDPYFKGTFWGKGKLYLYQLVGIAVRIVFDKNCRRLYTILKKFMNWLKKDEKSQEEK